ncbi:hypothetical protein DFH11DRAFT_1733673 [Phellopilus nigrolimitatus]|nr:hypothetical protein DFH11DRAFT_1733673 [Phellopilus nigrolimitatus]
MRLRAIELSRGAKDKEDKEDEMACDEDAALRRSCVEPSQSWNRRRCTKLTTFPSLPRLFTSHMSNLRFCPGSGSDGRLRPFSLRERGFAKKPIADMIGNHSGQQWQASVRGSQAQAWKGRCFADAQLCITTSHPTAKDVGPCSVGGKLAELMPRFIRLSAFAAATSGQDLPRDVSATGTKTALAVARSGKKIWGALKASDLSSPYLF